MNKGNIIDVYKYLTQSIKTNYCELHTHFHQMFSGNKEVDL